MKLLDQLGLQYLIEKFKERFDLKQDKLTVGDNITIDNNVISASGGSIVDLGTFNDRTDLFTYIATNQLPDGPYTFILLDAPRFMSLQKISDFYVGTYYGTQSLVTNFVISNYGELLSSKQIILADLADITYVDNQDALKADKTYVDSKVQTDVPSDAKFTDTITTINGKTGAISKEDILALGIQDGSGTGGGSIVDLGAFNDETELITHVVMNQLPTGHYTFIIGDYPYFMLLRLSSVGYYAGTFHSSSANFQYFNVSIYGEIQELKRIYLRDLMTDITP